MKHKVAPPINVEAPESPEFWKLFFQSLGLSLLVLAAFLPSLHAGYLIDDDGNLTQNRWIIDQAGLQGLKTIWTTNAANYFPLVLSAFWLEHLLWGLNPMPYHLVNLLLHATDALLLWHVLCKLGIPGAWLGAALWALHPVQVETVAWISEQKNTQSCLFFLLTVLFFLRWLEKGNALRYASALIFGILAILSKSSTVMLPVVLCLCWWWLEQGKRAWAWRNGLALWPFFLISSAAGLWTIRAEKISGAVGIPWGQSCAERLVNAGSVPWFYLQKLFWPDRLTFIYPRWEINVGVLLSWLPLVGGLFFLWIIWLHRDRSEVGRAVFFASAYFLASLFPVLGLLDVCFFRLSYVADHFQYLASMGPLALVAAARSILSARFQPKSLAGLPKLGMIAASLFLVILLGTLSWQQCHEYLDSETLWRRTLTKNPLCWIANNNLGSALLERGEREQAKTHLEQALKLHPDYVEAHSNLGALLTQEGRAVEAMFHLRRAVLLDPNFAEAHYNLGNALLQTGNQREAAGEFTKALEINPNHAHSENNLGTILLEQEQTREASGHFQRAISLNTVYPEAHYNMGRAMMMLGKNDGAAACFSKALELKPDYAGAHNNLGYVLLQQGKAAEAIIHFRKAIELNPKSAEAHFNLGTALAKSGDSQGTLAELNQAVELEPANQAYHNLLAWGLASCPDKSLRNGSKALVLALQVTQSKGGGDPSTLRTLAAAYAETGNFSKAGETAQKALNLAEHQGNSILSSLLRSELTLYKKNSPLP